MLQCESGKLFVSVVWTPLEIDPCRRAYSSQGNALAHQSGQSDSLSTSYDNECARQQPTARGRRRGGRRGFDGCAVRSAASASTEVAAEGPRGLRGRGRNVGRTAACRGNAAHGGGAGAGATLGDVGTERSWKITSCGGKPMTYFLHDIQARPFPESVRLP